jgi:hypothetical protein
MQKIGQKAGFLQIFTDFGEEKKAVFAFKKQKAKAAAFSAQANSGKQSQVEPLPVGEEMKGYECPGERRGAEI